MYRPVSEYAKNQAPKGTDQPENPPKPPVPEPPERDRLRDILIVIVTYPLTPTPKAKDFANGKPWLELLSLVLKAALAAYALWRGIVG